MSKFWDKPQTLGPSAGLVQQHFVKARQTELYRRDPALEERLKVILAKELPEVNQKGEKWLEVYHKIQKRLQSSELTINFKAEAWFTQENNYDSYTQTYERNSVALGRGVLASTAQDPAAKRAKVDDVVTLPKAWNGPSRPTQPSPGAAGATRRGLMPGLQSGQRIRNQMAFGRQDPHLQKDVYAEDFGLQIETTIESGNPYFNPKTKQVFAALNWGFRPNGSSVSYGHSFLVLNPKFKINALYFPGDTFYSESLGQDTSLQVPYGTLGAIMATNTSAKYLPDLAKTCYYGKQLGNTTDVYSLLEAHVFSELTFKGNIKEVCVATQRGTPIYKNAQKFCERIGAKLLLVASSG